MHVGRYFLYSVFLGLAIFLSSGRLLMAEEAKGNIEVFMGGKKYNSLDEYKRYKVEKALKKSQKKKAAEKSADADLNNLAKEVGKAVAALPGSSASEALPAGSPKTSPSAAPKDDLESAAYQKILNSPRH